jgi:hypothetical protein
MAIIKLPLMLRQPALLLWLPNCGEVWPQQL